jgi:hypothetical protein
MPKMTDQLTDQLAQSVTYGGGRHGRPTGCKSGASASSASKRNETVGLNLMPRFPCPWRG